MSINRIIFQDSIDPKYIKLFYGLIGVFVLILLWVIISPNHIKDGMTHLDEGNWDLAIESFSKANIDSDNRNQIMQGIALAKAYKTYQLKRWTEVFSILGNNDPITEYRNKYSALKESTQYKIDVDSVLLLIPRLKYLIQENINNDGSIEGILTIIGSKGNYKEIILSRYPNAHLIIDFSNRLKDVEESGEKSHSDLSKKREEINSELQSQIAKLAEIKKEGIRWRTFTIEKMFDQRYDDETSETKGVYSGISMSEYSEIVVIASDNEIPNSVYNRMSVPLLVKYLGNKGYIKGNGYGYKTNVYIPTYETVGKDMDPNVVMRDIIKLQKDNSAINSSISAIKNKSKSEKEKIITTAIGELKHSSWQ